MTDRVRKLAAVLVAAAATAALVPAVVATSTPLAATPAAAAPSSPNIVVIYTDDQVMDSIDGAMPYLRSLPGGGWVRFQNAYVNTGLCCPSRAQFFKGQYAHVTGVLGNEDGANFDPSVSLATWLKSAGYSTSLIGKYLNDWPFQTAPGSGVYNTPVTPPGWDNFVTYFGDSEKYRRYTMYENGTVVNHNDPKDYATNFLFKQTADWITAQPDGTPFYAMVSPFAPHTPAVPDAKYATALSINDIPTYPNTNEADVSDKPSWVQNLPLMTPAELNSMKAKELEVWRTVLSIDDGVKQVIEALQAKGVYDNTVIVFTSDNGFAWGAHRWDKKVCAYEECAKVPVLVRYPQLAPANRVENRLVTNVDWASTITDLAGTTPTLPQNGTSLVPLITNTATSWRDAVLLEWRKAPAFKPPTFWGIRTTRWKHVEYDNGDQELYDLVNDPWELQNLAGNPAYAAVEQELTTDIVRLRNDQDTVPTTTITSGPSGPTASTTATFAFSASEANSTFACSLDGAPAAPCTSGASFSGLAQGAHTIDIVATDAAGAPGPKASRSWTVDTVAPTATITSAPAAATTSTDAVVTFTADEAATFRCSIDGGAWAACASPVTRTGLADGARSVAVRAVDSAGNVGPTATASWTVDTIAPVASITSGPSGTSTSATGTFSISVDEPGTTLTCKIDGVAMAPCDTTSITPELSDGSHTFTVRATDAAGNVGPVASRTWNVAVTVADTVITSGPANNSYNVVNSVQYGFNAAPAPSSFECRFDGGAWTTCTSPRTLSGLAEGSHLFSVRGVGPTGDRGRSATRLFTVDRTNPVLTITSAPPALTNLTSITVAFSASEPVTATCSLDGATPAACSGSVTYSGLAAGDHNVKVRAVDRAGNSAAIVTASFTVDLTSPSLTVTAKPTGVVTSNAASISFTSDDPTATVTCSLDAGTPVPCTSPFGLAALPDGARTVTLVATDPAGNTSPTRVVSWIVDTAPPTISINGPSGPTASTSAQFTVTASEPSGLMCSIDGGAVASCTSPIGLTGLAQGQHSIAITPTDAAGTVGSTVTRTWRVDTVAPSIEITASPDNPSPLASAVFALQASEGNVTFSCVLDGGSATACTSPVSYTGLADGNHTFTVTPTDAAGNVGAPAVFGWEVATSDVEFADDFELGNTLAWTNAVTDNNDLQVRPGAAVVGTYGLAVQVNDTNTLFVRHNLPIERSRYRPRILVRTNGFSLPTGADITTMRITDAGQRELARVELAKTGSRFRFAASVLDANRNRIKLPYFDVQDGVHSLELDFQTASSSSASDGRMQFWVDGAPAGTITGFPTGTSKVARFDVGGMGNTTGAGTYHIDQVEARRTTFVGPWSRSSERIFADDFESGELSSWTSLVNSGTNLAVLPEAAIDGGFGARYTLPSADRTPLQLIDDTPAAESAYRSRFRLNLASLAMATNDMFDLVQGADATTGKIPLKVQIRQTATGKQIRAQLLMDNAKPASTTWVPLADGARTIDLEWRAAKTSSSADGVLRIWVDDALAATKSGVQNNGPRIDQIRVGAVSGLDRNTVGSFDLDSYSSTRVNYAGSID